MRPSRHRWNGAPPAGGGRSAGRWAFAVMGTRHRLSSITGAIRAGSVPAAAYPDQACRLWTAVSVVDRASGLRARSWPVTPGSTAKASKAPHQFGGHSAPALTRGVPPAPLHPATTSPARTAGRADRRRSIPTVGGDVCSCCNSSGSRPRSAQRATRFRSSGEAGGSQRGPQMRRPGGGGGAGPPGTPASSVPEWICPARRW